MINTRSELSSASSWFKPKHLWQWYKNHCEPVYFRILWHGIFHMLWSKANHSFCQNIRLFYINLQIPCWLRLRIHMWQIPSETPRCFVKPPCVLMECINLCLMTRSLCKPKTFNITKGTLQQDLAFVEYIFWGILRS